MARNFASPVRRKSVQRAERVQDSRKEPVHWLTTGGMMMRMFALLVAGGLLLSAPSLAQDKATIEKLNENFVGALQKGEMDSLGNMYAEDAYLLPPGAEVIKGREAIQAFWTKAATDIGDLKLTTIDVRPLGSDVAREIGTFTLKAKGQPESVAGKYVVLWQKVGSEWKLAADIWNTNK
jgi:uncharacterized protein (TIGR02246 family)